MTEPADPWFQDRFAERIGGVRYGKGGEIFKFERIKRAKRAVLAEHPERPLFDFGIGENDDMAAAIVRKALKREVDRPENRGYSDNGTAEFKEAAAKFMQRHFGVALDPTCEINHAIGSKPALAMLPAALINPGDVTLMTVPGYPVVGTHSRYYGGHVYNLPLRRENGYLPELGTVPADVLARAKLLVLNYPNSPTGGVATRDFYRQAIDFAHRHRLIIIQDAAHLLLTYRGGPLSFLSIDGAREVGLEVHSLSKGFNMIGWRMAFVAGHQKLVRAFADIKDNCDSGQFIPIQKAAIVALEHAEIFEATRRKYERRLRKLVAALGSVGFDAQMPGGSYFLYVKAPDRAAGRAMATAQEFSELLIREHSICCVPWDDVGPYLRFSATYPAATEADEDALMQETIERLKSLGLEFA
jgi:LL-diaminopimelate aminotransferase